MSLGRAQKPRRGHARRVVCGRPQGQSQSVLGQGRGLDQQARQYAGEGLLYQRKLRQEILGSVVSI